jgi:hypothetical protein
MMRKRSIIRGLTALVLAGYAGPACSQETLLTGLLNGLVPGSWVTWSSGASSSGTETYKDLFLSLGGTRARAAQVRVTPDGAISRVEADGVVLNLDADPRFALEIGRLAFSLSAPLIRASSDRTGVIDLCRIGQGGNAVQAEGVRLVRDVGADPSKRVQSEIRIGEVSFRQETGPAGSGCELLLSGRADGLIEVRSDKSGFRIDRWEADLSLPGSVETLVSGAATDPSLTVRFGGAERQLPGGGAVANVRDGTLRIAAPALGAVPVLTAFLRTRGAPAPERDAALMTALLQADIVVEAAVSGVGLLAEALIPGGLISGLSRASLSTVTGDYEATARLRGGQLALDTGSQITGVGSTRVETRMRLSPRPEAAAPVGVWPRMEAILPRVGFDAVSVTHQDEGLLRAIELISGSSVSVLAAIYLGEGVEAAPETLRPTLRRAVSDLARLSAMSASGEGARLTLSPLTDLSVQEILQLLRMRPELAYELIGTEIGPAPAPPD